MRLTTIRSGFVSTGTLSIQTYVIVAQQDMHSSIAQWLQPLQTGNPDSHRDRNRFSHYVRNAAVQLQAPAYSESECILEWNRNDEDVDLDGIELTARAANEDTHCRVLLNLEQYPPRWVAPDRLAAALGLQMLPTKENVLESLWAYIRRYQLLHAQDPTQVICDEVLRDVFGLGQISIDTLPGALDKVLRPADPLTFLYHLRYAAYQFAACTALHLTLGYVRLDDADKCRQVYDISMQIPDSHPSHIAALPETPERDAAEISQLHERCRSLLQEIGDRLQGYQFMAAFSESPVDVMRVAIANQARDLSILAGHGRHPSPFVDWGPGAADEYVSQFSRSS